MTLMRAAQFAGAGRISVVERDRPAPRADEALVRVRACGICGSDLHSCAITGPRTTAPGHEFAGEIVAAPAGATALRPGQRVAANPLLPCGTCRFCQRGAYGHCPRHLFIGGVSRDGGLAEYVALPAHLLYPLPDTLSWAEGALIEPLAVSVRAVGHAGVKAGDAVAVLGAGSIGLTAILAARAAGAARVVATAKYPHQAEAALRAGATDLVEPPDQTFLAEVLRLTAGEGVDTIFDSVGVAEQPLAEALAALRNGGAYVLLGLSWQPVRVDLTSLLLREQRILTSITYSVRGAHNDFQRAIDLVAAGHVSLGGLVTHRFPLAETAEAFRVAADKRTGALKVQILP
jgi:2-desacetyl-2-hydroxyethyl bacteriochlorophyllide A dehydrogenase